MLRYVRVVPAIVHRQEQSLRGAVSSSPRSGGSDGQRCDGGFRELDGDARAMARLRVEAHGPAVQLDDALDNGQSESRPPVPRALAAALEPIEYAALLILGDADAAVLDGEHHHAVLAPAREADGIAGLGETDGVGEEIVEHLPDAGLIRRERDGIVGDRYIERQAGAARALANAKDGGIEHLPDIDLSQLQLERSGIDRRQVEDVVDDRKH